MFSRKLKRYVLNFILNGHDKIKRNILYLKCDKGGLKMLNFKYMIYAQRVVWIKKLLGGNNDMKWKQFFEYIFRTVGGKLIFLCNYNPKTINIKAPNLYLDFFEHLELSKGEGIYCKRNT